MGSDHHCDDQVDALTADLELCRAELALARRQHEEAAEELALAQQRQRDLRKRTMRLARAVDDLLVARTDAATPTERVRRAFGRPDTETEQAALIRSSGLLDPAWYLLQHPGIVGASVDPVRHFLRHGAAAGWDPSPDFSTRGFLRDNPDVAASGVNPLVAHLHRARAAGESAEGTA